MAEVAGDPEVPNIRAKRFVLLTGLHTYYKCAKETRVSAIGLADHEELDEDGYEQVEDCALFTQLGHLNAEAANQVETRAPWLRFDHSMTADATYLANHCEHCDTLAAVRGHSQLAPEVWSDPAKLPSVSQPAWKVRWNRRRGMVPDASDPHL